MEKKKALVLKGGQVPGETGYTLENRILKRARKAAEEIRAKGCWPAAHWRDGGLGTFGMKKYLNRVKQGIVPTTYWSDDDYETPFAIGPASWEHTQSGHSQIGINELSEIVGKDHGFATVKPMKLIKKIVQLWCGPNGVVLDPFAGSGTTGHAVLELNVEAGTNRRFILIEQGRPEKGDSYARSLAANRLRRAVLGEWKSGQKPPLGGGYRFSQIQQRVDAGALLAMERDEMADTVIASHYDSNRRGGPSLILMKNEGHKYLVARNSANEGFFLVWSGASEAPVFNEDVYEDVVVEALKAGLKPIYHVYARFNFFQSDDVRFYQIPDQILLDFGLNANDAFNNSSMDQ